MTDRTSNSRVMKSAVILLLLCGASVEAQPAELSIEPRSAGLDEPVTITVTLEGDFARLDDIDLPVTNLTIESGPSVSSQFEWRNGVTSRQKIFRWTAYGDSPGPAAAGPLRLESAGKATVLPRVPVSILPDPLANVRSPDEAVRRLLEAGREVIFLLPEIERAELFTGEQVLVTWYLYSAEPFNDFDISSTPSFRDFWVEEIPLADEPTREVRLEGVSLRRYPVRRVALFPLRSGRLNVGKLVAVAEVMRPISDRFGIPSLIERRVGRIILRAPAPELVVNPVPAGQQSDAVGRFALSCSEPRVPEQGPISFDVVVKGEGNLRSAHRPRFTSDSEARVEVQEGEVTVERTGGRVTMSRVWRFILFPRVEGNMSIPRIVFRAWNPSDGRVETLECPGRQVVVRQVFDDKPVEPIAASERGDTKGGSRILVVGVMTLLLIAALVWWIRGRRRGMGLTRNLMQHAGNPAALRTTLHEVLANRGASEQSLMQENSELGETYRALRSLLDIRERETLTADRSPRELERRIREFARELDRTFPPTRG